MNDLCFFLKSLFFKPGEEDFTPAQRVFGPFFGAERLCRQRCGPIGRRRFQPEAALSGPQPDARPQLDRPCPPLHRLADQADIQRLGVPVGGHQGVGRRLQNERVGPLQRLQHPDAGPGAGRPGGGFRQQGRGGAVKIGTGAGGFLAEAGQVALGPGVGLPEGRQGVVAQPVAGVGVREVGLVGDPALAGGPAVILHFFAGQAKQGPDVKVPRRADAPRPVQPCPPRQTEQQRLGLVSDSMGRGDAVYPRAVGTGKAGVAQSAGPGLPARGAGQAVLPGAVDSQRHPQPGALGPDEGLVGVGIGPAQPVVDMAGGHLHPQPPGQGQQHAQQRHAVRSARDGRGHPLPMRKKPGLLAPGKHAGFRIVQNRRIHRSCPDLQARQCRKSTSIKRVWAPSQPSGTVLVSPWRFLATMHSAVSASTSAPSGCWLA